MCDRTRLLIIASVNISESEKSYNYNSQFFFLQNFCKNVKNWKKIDLRLTKIFQFYKLALSSS